MVANRGKMAGALISPRALQLPLRLALLLSLAGAATAGMLAQPTAAEQKLLDHVIANGGKVGAHPGRPHAGAGHRDRARECQLFAPQMAYTVGRECPTCLRGLVATRDIKKDEEVLGMPTHLAIRQQDLGHQGFASVRTPNPQPRAPRPAPRPAPPHNHTLLADRASQRCRARTPLRANRPHRSVPSLPPGVAQEYAHYMLRKMHFDDKFNNTYGLFLDTLPKADELLSAELYTDNVIDLLQTPELVRPPLRPPRAPRACVPAGRCGCGARRALVGAAQAYVTPSSDGPFVLAAPCPPTPPPAAGAPDPRAARDLGACVQRHLPLVHLRVDGVDRGGGGGAAARLPPPGGAGELSCRGAPGRCPPSPQPVIF